MTMLLLAACLWGVTLAQNRTINPDVRIVGCPEFGCPNTTQNINRDWDTAECRLGFQTTAAAVGIAENVIEVPGTDTKLSLTMARKFYIKGGEPSPARVDRDENQMFGFDHHYFISKPPNFSLKTPGSNITLGCLLFSHNFFHTFSYNEPNGNSSTTCPFPSDCYKLMLAPILIYRMANSSTGAVATDGPCGSLGSWVERNWLDNPDMNKCTTGRGESLTGWRHSINMTGLEFLGSGAPDTIEEVDKENSRSTDDRCRPTLPKGNQMARLGDDRFIIGNKYGNNILASPKQEGLDGFIPSISVIFHESGERTIRVMCMRIVGNPPYQQGSSGSATGAAVARLGPEMGVLVGAALFAGWAVVHLL